jgi:N-acetylmuramoyl-L-alanine amidase
VVLFRNRSVLLSFIVLLILSLPSAASASCGSVVLDPGHGGSDPGAVGPSGFTEKEANLDIALRARNLLRGNGYQVVMTRDSDVAVSLERRVQIANSSGAKAFISIHNNAAASSAAHGTETYYWSGASADSAGAQLARLIQEEVVAEIGLRNRGVLGADFYVLRNTIMPAALLEGAFISNPTEEQLLMTPSFRQRIAEGVYRGIRRFVGPGTKEPSSVTRKIEPGRRARINLNNLFCDASLGMRVTADSRVTAERVVHFNYKGARDSSISIGTPTPGKTWFLAEGQTGQGVDSWILLLNPGTAATTATIKYLTSSGVIRGGTVDLPPRSRRSVNAKNVVANQSFSVEVIAGGPIVVERSMFSNNSGSPGGFTTMGTKSTSANWYFPEGRTGKQFETQLLLLNPNKERARARITYLTPDGPVDGPSISIPGRRRRSVRVNDSLPNTELSMIVTADRRIVAERSTYFTFSGIKGAHNTMGARSPSKRWLFAEGSTKEGFTQFLTLLNQGSNPAKVSIVYRTAKGSAIKRSTTVPPRSRQKLSVGEKGQAGPNKDVSTRVVSDQPIVAERTIYFDDGSYRGGHSSIGVRGGGRRWIFAEGATHPGFESQLVIGNPNSTPANVKVEFFKQ